jgi:hypothetical protein
MPELPFSFDRIAAAGASAATDPAGRVARRRAEADSLADLSAPVTAPPSRSLRQPSLRELGLHELALLLLALNGAVAAATLPFYSSFGLEIDWATFVPSVIAIAFAAVAWFAHCSRPGRPSEWPVSESFVAFALFAVLFTVVTPAQYLAVALNRPLVDPWLAQADALLGISVPDAVAWTVDHPRFARILLVSYHSLGPQFIAAMVLLGLFYRDRDALWEFMFNFHVCLILTLIGLVLFPAMCAFSYYGFESLIDQGRFIRHFEALRNGSFKLLQLRELEGLITFPSFHVAGGLMVAWAFRRRRWMFAAFAVLNTLMIVSTVLLGPHYAVDILASAAVFATSAWLYRRWGRALTGPRSRMARVAAPAHAGTN